MTEGALFRELLEKTPDSLEELLAVITPEIHASLKQSVELQRWPDGVRLNKDQLEYALQLIILYEHHNLPEDARIGRSLNQTCDKGDGSDNAQPLQVTDNGVRRDS